MLPSIIIISLVFYVFFAIHKDTDRTPIFNPWNYSNENFVNLIINDLESGDDTAIMLALNSCLYSLDTRLLLPIKRIIEKNNNLNRVAQARAVYNKRKEY